MAQRNFAARTSFFARCCSDGDVLVLRDMTSLAHYKAFPEISRQKAGHCLYPDIDWARLHSFLHPWNASMVVDDVYHRWLSSAIHVLAWRCLRGLRVDCDYCRRLVLRLEVPGLRDPGRFVSELFYLVFD